MSTSQSNQDLHSILKSMQRAHIKSGPADLATRQDRLARSIRLIKENYTDICAAMSADFGHRSQYQSMVADMVTTIKMLQNAHDNVGEWMKPEHVEDLEGGIQAWIQQQPLGVIGVISPWNFPINLSFGPLASIFAAGNTAMLKPSELTPQTSELLADLIGRYFDPMELEVVLGDADVGREFSALPFDHLVFTGSTVVGKHVMRAAAENLVPVTLELGGKSPVVVDQDFDLATAVQRTLTIKTFNSGQICLSPDYMLIPEGNESAFAQAAQAFVAKSFASIQTNEDYTAIISDRHFQRLVGLLDDAQEKGATIINLGPENEPAYDAKTRKIAPHLVLNASDDMAIMQEEIFGPLLPVKTYQALDQAIEYINNHDRPLAAYFFSNNTVNQDRFAQFTTSGALVINDVMTHASIDELPFGGVGASGIGAYHGVHGFRQFTHAKPVVVQSEDGASNLRLRAPYADNLAALEAFLSA
ncbi:MULTISPECIES: coniferyl aldehyde dehydrogenase [Vibrio]|uniref:Aldehyde dehydrogenase n=2 Tax=Vibrio TaxID=662 RepID=A0A7X4LPT3_9VIBR|nr:MULTISPECIES: coniferyl aldehyde dehydrogenase [Vibrio]MBF9003045.1 coniferyl aldehyde dehydrogenase [Vibrio nitrifigilis]MZI95386.1 aldehyde dehydrogenase family protein [Vibrio eleionomae]